MHRKNAIHIDAPNSSQPRIELKATQVLPNHGSSCFVSQYKLNERVSSCSRIADFALKQLLLWVVKLWLALSVQKTTNEEVTFDELVDTVPNGLFENHVSAILKHQILILAKHTSITLEHLRGCSTSIRLHDSCGLPMVGQDQVSRHGRMSTARILIEARRT
jgi:hypothetical protein